MNVRNIVRKELIALLAIVFIGCYSILLCLFVGYHGTTYATAELYSDIMPYTSWMPDYSNDWINDKISLDKAWGITTGSSEVLVGVLDSGIDATHRELHGFINEGLSKDFGDTNAPLVDSVGHGTAMASLIVSKGLMLNGVCKNVKLVSLKIRDSGGFMFSHYVASAINYAAENNIRILNISAGNFINDAELREAVDNYPGLIVTAAGNEGKDLDGGYLSYLPSYTNYNILTVGASTQNDTILEVGNAPSNYGSKSVDLFAPGDDVNFAYPSNQYAMGDGSSASCALVSGVAALLLSIAPNIKTVNLKNSIMNNVDKIDSLSGKCVTGGRLNAYKALENRVHEFTYRMSNPATVHYHVAYCSACGYSVNQAHSWYSSRGKYVCMCGQSTDYLPIIGL